MGLQGGPPVKPGHGGADRPQHRSATADPERTQRLVWSLLQAVADADAGVTGEERAILERYRLALGIQEPETKERKPAFRADAATLDLGAVPVNERVHAMRMMLGVAYADGACSDVEQELLEKLARILGLSAVQFADLRVFFEQRWLDRRRRRWWLAWAGLAVVLAAAFGGWLYVRWSAGVSTAAVRAFVVDATQQIDGLQQRLDQVEDTGTRLRGPETDSVDLVQLSTAVQNLLAEVERIESKLPGTRDPQLAAEVQRVKHEVVDLQSKLDVRQQEDRLLARFSDSVVLIEVSYTLVSGKRRVPQTGHGTGFFVSADGLIATNKHIVQPWLFDGLSVALLDRGYVLDEASIYHAAWQNGARIKDDSGQVVYEDAFDSRSGKLKIAKLPPDRTEQRVEPVTGGGVHKGRYHVLDSSDLALLQAAVPAPVRPVPLAEDLARLSDLDRVLVLGFPTGLTIQESPVLDAMAIRADVLKIDHSLFIKTQIPYGSSGSPVIDLHGRAVGIATRRVSGGADVGVCIQIPHLRSLLPADSVLATGTAPAVR